MTKFTQCIWVSLGVSDMASNNLHGCGPCALYPNTHGLHCCWHSFVFSMVVPQYGVNGGMALWKKPIKCDCYCNLCGLMRLIPCHFEAHANAWGSLFHHISSIVEFTKRMEQFSLMCL